MEAGAKRGGHDQDHDQDHDASPMTAGGQGEGDDEGQLSTTTAALTGEWVGRGLAPPGRVDFAPAPGSVNPARGRTGHWASRPHGRPH